MNDGGPHVVVAVMRAMRGVVFVLFEFKFAFLLPPLLRQANPGEEGMRLRNLVARLQVSAAVLEREQLPAAIRPDGLDGEIAGLRRHTGIRRDAEARRHVVFIDIDFQHTAA